jgi:hypothetical protein
LRPIVIVVVLVLERPFGATEAEAEFEDEDDTINASFAPNVRENSRVYSGDWG